MDFTANEMTCAIRAIAESMLAADGSGRKWAGLGRYEQFTILDSIGSDVLPCLSALPQVDIAPGERASYTEEQVATSILATVQRLIATNFAKQSEIEFRDDLIESTWMQLPEQVRTEVIRAHTAMTMKAIAFMPVRPTEEFVVPDDLTGLVD